MGIEDVVDGKFTEETPAVEAPQPEAPAEAIEPVAEPAPGEVPEAPAEPVKEEHSVPLATALNWRDGEKEAKARAADLERRLAEFEASKQPSNVPDPLDDPNGFKSHVEQLVNQRTTAQKFEMSDVIAKREFGEDTVNAAVEWAQGRAAKDPTFVRDYMANPHPVDWIVRQHQRDSLVSQLPSDITTLDELVEREIAKRGLIATAAAPAVAVTQQAPATPPRSLASSPSKHGGVKDVPTGPLMALTEMFPG